MRLCSSGAAARGRANTLEILPGAPGRAVGALCVSRGSQACFGAVVMEPRFVESTREPGAHTGDDRPRDPVIVLAHHPMLARVGETLALGRGVTEISRLAPSFVGDDGHASGPIDDPFVSRQPIALRRLADGAIEVASPGVDVTVGGAAVPAGGVLRIAGSDLAHGVPIALAHRCDRSAARGQPARAAVAG